MRAVVASLLAGVVIAYPDGIHTCRTAPNHGTSKAASSPFTLTLTDSLGNAASTWTAGETYTVRLSGGNMAGFSVEARRGTTRSGSTSVAGTLTPGTNAQKATSCSSYNQMTHTSRSLKTAATFSWAAPTTAGVGDLSIWATVVTAHSQPYAETSVVIPEAAGDPSSSPSPSASATATASATPSTTASISPGASPSTTSSATPSPSTTSSATPSPTPTPTPSAPPSTAAKVSLVLALAIEDVGGGDTKSSEHQVFVQSFTSDVAAALNISASRIANVTVTPGSIVVDFIVLSPPADRVGVESSVVDAVAKLEAQVKDESSPLRSGSGFAAQVDPTAGVTSVVASDVSGLPKGTLPRAFKPSSLANAVVLSGSKPDRVVFRWSIVEESGAKMIRGQLEWSGDSWAAIAFNPDLVSNGMVGSYAIIGFPGAATSDRQVLEADLFNTSKVGVVVQGSQNLGVASLRQESASAARRLLLSPWSTGGRMLQGSQVYRMDFSRPLNAPHPGDMDLSESADTLVAYALGGSSSESVDHSTMLYHENRRGKMTVNLGTGKASAAPLDPILVLHGSIMFLAWGVLLPLGALSSRLCRNLKPDSGPNARWFCMHWSLQVSGFTAAMIGFVLAVIMVINGGGSHFDSLHKAVGLAVLLLATLLVLAGRLRPPKTATLRPLWALAHKGGGWLTIILAVVAIVTGLLRAEAMPGLIVGAAVVVGIILMVSLVGTCLGIGQQPATKKPVVGTEKVTTNATLRSQTGEKQHKATVE